jgi:hypothetical protein
MTSAVLITYQFHSLESCLDHPALIASPLDSPSNRRSKV